MRSDTKDCDKCGCENKCCCCQGPPGPAGERGPIGPRGMKGPQGAEFCALIIMLQYVLYNLNFKKLFVFANKNVTHKNS